MAALLSAAATDPGKIRTCNEDALLARPDHGLWVVADGMGGHQAGDFASLAVIAALAAIDPRGTGAARLLEIHERLARVNDRLRAEAARRRPPAVIGSTVVVLLVDQDRFACVWAGDSRLYRLRAGRLECLTRDHSQVQELVDAGLMSRDQAERHPLSNVVTRAIGGDAVLALDEIGGVVVPGDRFLLCSDGLTKAVAEARIEQVLTEAPLLLAPARLIEQALAAGGPDNVTVAAVEILAPANPSAM
jgi:serine/threonine protein phosphatase PrpC